MNVLLDSTYLIKAERREWKMWQMLAALEHHVGNGDIGISVISLMELSHGAVRADTPQRTLARDTFLEQVANDIMVHPVTVNIAKRAGRLDGLLASQGARTATADLLIASTALELGYAVVTANTRHFGRIPGVHLLVL